jgi:hypothetical protein
MSSTECPALARLEARGPPPGPEPTTMYSKVLLSIDVAAIAFRLSNARAEAKVKIGAMVDYEVRGLNEMPLKE